MAAAHLGRPIPSQEMRQWREIKWGSSTKRNRTFKALYYPAVAGFIARNVALVVLEAAHPLTVVLFSLLLLARPISLPWELGHLRMSSAAPILTSMYMVQLTMDSIIMFVFLAPTREVLQNADLLWLLMFLIGYGVWLLGTSWAVIHAIHPPYPNLRIGLVKQGPPRRPSREPGIPHSLYMSVIVFFNVAAIGAEALGWLVYTPVPDTDSALANPNEDDTSIALYRFMAMHLIIFSIFMADSKSGRALAYVLRVPWILGIIIPFFIFSEMIGSWRIVTPGPIPVSYGVQERSFCVNVIIVGGPMLLIWSNHPELYTGWMLVPYLTLLSTFLLGLAVTVLDGYWILRSSMLHTFLNPSAGLNPADLEEIPNPILDQFEGVDGDPTTPPAAAFDDDDDENHFIVVVDDPDDPVALPPVPHPAPLVIAQGPSYYPAQPEVSQFNPLSPLPDRAPVWSLDLEDDDYGAGLVGIPVPNRPPPTIESWLAGQDPEQDGQPAPFDHFDMGAATPTQPVEHPPLPSWFLDPEHETPQLLDGDDLLEVVPCSDPKSEEFVPAPTAVAPVSYITAPLAHSFGGDENIQDVLFPRHFVPRR